MIPAIAHALGTWGLGWRILAAVLLTALTCGMAGVLRDLGGRAP